MRRSVHPWGNRFLVALRARQLDTWADDFLRRNSDAVVLPEVIRLRRLLYTERPGYPIIGSSVTEPGWLDEIPANRPR
jgi:O-methyltransferase involved in polyketide biosynthesis